MYVVSDAFPSQAAHASTVAIDLLPGRPAVLAVVKKARVELRALPDALSPSPRSAAPDPEPELLSVVSEIPVIGSIISIRSIPRPGQPTSALLVLVDPGDEHLLLVTAERAHAGAAYFFDVRANIGLTLASSMISQSAMGMWTDPHLSALLAAPIAIDVPIAIYTRSRVLGFLLLRLSGGRLTLGPDIKTKLPLPHADVLSITPLYRRSLQDPATYAVLGISSFPAGPIGTAPQGLPVLYFVTLCPTVDKGFTNCWAGPESWASITEHLTEPSSPTQPRTTGAKRKKSTSAPQSQKGKGKSRALQVDPDQVNWVDAHVPLDPLDALSAHLITSLPLSYGGGVLVFTEQAVLHTPPPLGVALTHSAGYDSRKRPRMGGALSASQGEMREVLKASLARPVQVVAATPVEVKGNRYKKVLFATHGGDLYITHLDVDGDMNVRNVSIHTAGRASKPAGPEALTHLGDGFVHIASASGDVMVVELHGFGLSEGRSLETGQYKCTVMQRWPQIGPVLGVALAGERRVAFGSRQSTAYDDQRREDYQGSDRSERIITASGTEGSGSIRTLRHGLPILPIYDMDFPSQPSTQQWLLSPGGKTKLLARTVFGKTYWYRLLPGEREVDVTPASNSPVCADLLAVTQLEAGIHAHLPLRAAIVVTRGCACVVDLAAIAEERGHEAVLQTYVPDLRGNHISAATISADGRIVLASSGKVSTLDAIKVTVCQNSSIPQFSFDLVSTSSSEPIAILALSPPARDMDPAAIPPRDEHGLVAMGTWGRTKQIRLVYFARLHDDATPLHVKDFFQRSQPQHASFDKASCDRGKMKQVNQALVRPTSLLLRRFTKQDSGVILVTGWADGTLLYTPLHIVAYSSSQDSSAYWTRVAAGKSPLSLSPVTIPGEKVGVLVGQMRGRPSLLTLPPHPPIISTRGWTGMPALKVHAVDADVHYASQLSCGENPVAAFFSRMRCSVARWGDLEPWSVYTLPLGDDQPTCLLQTGEGLVVGTWPFQRYGEDCDPVQVNGDPSLLHTMLEANGYASTPSDQHGSLRLITPNANGDFNKVRTVVPLGPRERPNCLCSFKIDRRSSAVAIGTGILQPDKTEVTEGRIIIMRIDQTTANVSIQVATPGNVFALTQVGQCLVAAHNGCVSTFTLGDYESHCANDESSIKEVLRLENSWESAFVVTSLSPVYEGPMPRRSRMLNSQRLDPEARKRLARRRWDFARSGCWLEGSDDSGSEEDDSSHIPREGWDSALLLVGDAMRSASLLRIHGVELDEEARDAQPIWTNAVGFLDLLAQIHVSSDADGNLMLSRRKVRKAFDPDTNPSWHNLKPSWDTQGFEGRDHQDWQVWEDNAVFEHSLERFASFHYGDVINSFVRGLSFRIWRAVFRALTDQSTRQNCQHPSSRRSPCLDRSRFPPVTSFRARPE